MRSYADTAAKAKCGDRDGTRLLIEVLLLHRQLPAEAVIAGMATMVKVGSVNPDLVAIEARKAMENTGLDDGDDTDADEKPLGSEDEDVPAGEGATVISLHTRRLPPDPRAALPDMAKYDRLLAPVTSTKNHRKGTSA